MSATVSPTSVFRSMSRPATVSMAGQLPSTDRMEAMQGDFLESGDPAPMMQSSSARLDRRDEADPEWGEIRCLDAAVPSVRGHSGC
jgi:hypothetical protein